MSNGRKIVIAATVAAGAAGSAYLLYRSIPALMTKLTKMQLNPLDDEVGQLIPEKDAPPYEEIISQGIIEGKSALVVGGTRGVGFGTALVLAKSGASMVTMVGRNETNGSKAASRIRSELPSSSSTEVNFLQGDIGTVASTNDLLEKLIIGVTRYDYLIVTAAIFPQPKSRNRAPLNDDGVEKSFGIGVVGRFLLFRKAHIFMKHPNDDDNDDDHDGSYSPMILNVCAAGANMPRSFDRKLVRSLGYSHMFNIANFAIGNEIMLHKLVDVLNKGNSDGTPFNIPVITTHPGFLQTELHRGQGFLMDLVELIMVHFMGCSEEECGRREVSILCAIGNQRNDRRRRGVQSSALLTIVDNFGYGRLINDRMARDLRENGDWLWELLVSMENGISPKNVED